MIAVCALDGDWHAEHLAEVLGRQHLPLRAIADDASGSQEDDAIDLWNGGGIV
jgi:hypothetical protein